MKEVVSDLNRLEMLGNEAKEPLSKHLEDDIFELRSIFGNNIVRILYFFDEDEIIIATNGFVKTNRKRLAVRYYSQRKEEISI